MSVMDASICKPGLLFTKKLKAGVLAKIDIEDWRCQGALRHSDSEAIIEESDIREVVSHGDVILFCEREYWSVHFVSGSVFTGVKVRRPNWLL